jgi:hypothetical protein
VDAHRGENVRKLAAELAIAARDRGPAGEEFLAWQGGEPRPQLRDGALRIITVLAEMNFWKR